MNFAGVAVVVTAVTLLCIFSFYRIILYKAPEPEQNNQPSASANASPTPTPSIKASPSPSPSPKARITVRGIPSATPKGSPAVTVLQNNLQNPTQSTTGNSIISGLLYFNGTAPSGSSVVIVGRPNNSNGPDQTFISGLNPQTGTTFSWNNAASGTTYNMVAVLKQSINGTITDIAQSTSYTLAAPTNNFQFTINVGYPLATPTGNITLTCNTHYSNNTWSATVNYPPVSGAQGYFLQMGSTSGGTDLVNIAAVDPYINVTINDSQAYYAQYSASSVSNPTAYQYSSFSTPQLIRC